MTEEDFLKAQLLKKQKKDRKKLEKWLDKNGWIVNITALEKKANTGKGTVHKHIKYEVPIATKHIPNLLSVIETVK